MYDNIRIHQGFPHCVYDKITVSRSSSMVGLPGVPGCRVAGLPGCRVAGLPVCRVAGLPGCWFCRFAGLAGMLICIALILMNNFQAVS